MASELIAHRTPVRAASPGAAPADEIIDVREPVVDLRDTPADGEAGCVVCGAGLPEAGGCCSSKCAGEAQRQLRRNAARLRRLERRDGHELRHRLAERNGRLMSALLRWRPEGRQPSLS